MSLDVNERLLAKLQELADHAEELNNQLMDPEIAANPKKSLVITKELGRLRRLVNPFKTLRKAQQGLLESKEILNDKSQDAEIRELAELEIDELQNIYDERLEHLKSLIVTDDDAAITSVIIEIRAGTGGDEAALFCRDLYNMYQRYCEKKNLKVEPIELSASDKGGLKEITFGVKGTDVFRILGYEGGGHRVQRVPDTETQGRIHTSAATVAVLPEPEEINIEVKWDTDVDEFVSRAGGPGGQNVNKVSSAIKMTHKETGITVSMRDEKSQHKNRAKAKRIMLTRLFDHYNNANNAERDQARRSMIGSGDRSQRIRTYNFPQNRLTDHRINLDLHNLEKIMQGELDTLIDALQTHDKEQRLKNL